MPQQHSFQALTSQQVELLRLVLSTYQDGTGMLVAPAKLRRPGLETLPGWRDFERSVAVTLGGTAQENKAICDVLVPLDESERTFYGISCKMRKTLPSSSRETMRSGRVTMELSNANKQFWDALAALNINPGNYQNEPEIVGRSLVSLVKTWHEIVDVAQGGHIDISRSYYLVLMWNNTLRYQLYQFPFELPDPKTVQWSFAGKRMIGEDATGILFEWYGESGGQLKYYPRIENAAWVSDIFQLEPLDEEAIVFGAFKKVEAYFPTLWANMNLHGG